MAHGKWGQNSVTAREDGEGGEWKAKDSGQAGLDTLWRARGHVENCVPKEGPRSFVF